MNFQQLQDLALALPAADREQLAQTLLGSLEVEPLSEVETAWLTVSEHRMQELLDGSVRGLSEDEVIPEIKREMGWQD